MNEREEKIIQAAEEVIPELFEKSSEETILYCEKNSTEMVEGFLEAFRNVLEQAVDSLQESSDNKIGYLLFSCLHSSIFLRNYMVRIDLMGDDFYKKEALATSYWDAGNIYLLFEQDIESIRQKVGKKVPRIRAYEVDYIRYTYEWYYHRMAEEFIREMLGGMFGNTSKTNMRKEEEIKILFGEYMGTADFLYHIGKEELYEVFQDICR